MNRLVFSISALLLSFSCVLFLNVSTTYAAKKTNTLTIGGQYTVGPLCNVTDLTTQWNAGVSGNPFYYKNTWNYQTNYDSAVSKQDAFYNDLMNKINTGDSGWAVGNYAYSGYFDNNNANWDNYPKEIAIYTFPVDTQILVKNDGSITTNKPVKRSTYFLNYNSSCRLQAGSLGDSSSNYFVEANMTKFLFIASDHVTYESGYTGDSIPDQYQPPQDLKPDYNWSVSTDGKLKVEYLKNLPHFLTGISYLKIDKMTNNWAGLDSTLSTITVNPAGWLNEEYQLPSPGYYMFDVSHNQQLDQPPWPTDKSYTVKQIWVQFYWDGKSFVNGSTVGCTDGICNDFKDDKSKVDKLFGGISIPTHGLQAAITAPLTFWASLPSATSSCSALSINLPLLNRSITLPCLTASVYQPHFPALLALWQTATTGIVAYWLSIKLFGHIKDINSPDKDRIEVSHL